MDDKSPCEGAHGWMIGHHVRGFKGGGMVCDCEGVRVDDKSPCEVVRELIYM